MEFIEKFKRYLLGNSTNASQVTVKNYLADIKHFISWLEITYKKSFSPSDVTIQIINQFKANKLCTLSASSVDRHLSSLRKFFTFLKLSGDISSSPFDEVIKSSEAIAKDDPNHVHDFKNYLYVYNASHLTIKNYIIDVKQFFSWAEEVLQVRDAWHVADKNVLARIDNSLVEAYKNRLLTQHIFSASSINRKLSSLRKYLAWAGEQGYLSQELSIKNYELGNGPSLSSSARLTPRTVQSNRAYSNIPPIRLFQKLTNAGTVTFDVLITAPLAELFRKVEHGKWVLKGKPLFIPAKRISHIQHQLTNVRQFASQPFKTHVGNISKEFYAPLLISTRNFPWYKKAWFHARHTRPQWYHRYHELALAHYFNWAVLIIFATAIGFGMYTSFVEKPGKSLAALPNQPIRVLSFQGRLTDANNNPITTPSWIRFEIYNDQSSSSSARLWEEVDKVSPDQDGIFSLLLGSSGLSNGSAATLCNAGNPPASPATGACGIPQTLFANNNALWLGVTVENTAELAPREQLATVAYASNAETLQGLPPITQSGAGTNNVVLALNSYGNLAIGASTTFQSTSGQFTVSGNTVALNTNAGTNGNITLTPDGLGTIDLQRPLQTSTNNGDIASVPNALTIEDLAAILATSSGQSALTINQNGTGPIISASHSGTAEFTVDSSGNGTFAGNVTGNTIYTGNGTTYFINNTTSNLNSLTLANNLIVSGNVSSNLTPSIANTDTYNLGTSASQEWLALYAKNIYSNGQLLANYWQENLGALSPIHTRDDLLIGGTATSDAKFQVFGSTYNTAPAGTASTSGYVSFQGTPGSQTLFKQQLLNGSNLGIYPSVGGEAGISSTPSLYIANTGNVGVGTSTPADTFDVSGTNNSSAIQEVIQNLGNGTNANTALVVNNNGGKSITTTQFSSGYTGTWSGISMANFSRIRSVSTTGLVLAISTASPLIFGTNDVERMRIDATGTVSIGTSTPLTATGLQVNRDSLGNATAAIVNTSTANVADLFTASNSAGTKFTIQNDGTLVAPKYTTDKGLLYLNGTTGTVAETAQGGANTVLHGNATGIPTFSAVDLTADVTGTLPINKGGTNGTATPTNGGIAYGTGTAYAFSAVGGIGQCLTSNGAAAPTWASCATGGAGTNYWTLNAGALDPIYPSVDILVGSATNATTSAKFAVTGIAGALTPAASVSATVATGGNGNGIVIKGDGTIQSLENNQLILGGNTTGDIVFKPANGGGSGNLQVIGFGQGIVHSNSSGVLSSSRVDLSNGSNDITNTLALANGGTGQNSYTNGDLLYYNSGTSTTALTRLGIGADNTVLNIDPSTHLPVWTASPTFTNLTVTGTGNFNGFITGTSNQILPSGNGSVNLGGTSNYFNTIYANSFSSPAGNGVSGFWTVTNNTNLYPTNTADDLLIGGTSTGSATPFQIFAQTVGVNTAGTATTSGNITFRGTPTSQTQFQINYFNGSSLVFNRSVGGDAGKTAILTLGNDGNITDAGNLAVNGGSLTSTQTTFNLLTGATTLGVGGSSGTTTINNNLAITGTTSLIGNLVSSIIPDATTRNLGSVTNNFGSIFANNFISPIGSNGIAGYWQLTAGVISPTNLQNDFSIGGNATGSATPFQIFGQQYSNGSSINSGNVSAGTATTSGNLTFRGATGSQSTLQVNILNNANLGFFSSVGGDNGLSASSPTLFLSGSNVGINTTNPTAFLDVNGAASVSSTLTFHAGGGTIQATKNEILTLGGNTTGGIVFGSTVTSNIIPSLADTYNLGSGSNEWNNLYVKQIISPSGGGISGYWQLNAGVLAPVNISNDLVIGVNNPANTPATSSALFQVFGKTNGVVIGGTASTAANFTFNGTNVSNAASINLLNNSTLGVYNSPGGDAGLSATPTLFLAASGNVGIGTNGPNGKLDIVYADSSANGTAGLRFQNNATGGDTWYARVGATGTNTPAGGFSLATAANYWFNLANFGAAGIGTLAQGNGALVVNQNNNSGLGDIFSASSSATTEFVINNNGDVGIGPSMKTAQGILDVASQGPLFPSDLTLGQATATNFIPNPSFEGNSSTGWGLGTDTALATDNSVFGQTSIKFNNGGTGVSTRSSSACVAVTPSTTYTISAYIYNSLSAGLVGIEFGTYTDSACASTVTTTGRVNIAGTNTWIRDTSTKTLGSGVNSVRIRFDTDSSAVGTVWADGFQLEQSSSATPYLDGSLGPGYYWTGAPNNSTSVRIGGAAFAYKTLNSASGIGAASKSIYPTLQLDQNGTGDIIAASVSGTTQFRITNTGQLFARNLYDLDNPIYYIDPAGLTTSASLAGSMTFTPTAEHDINFLNGSNLNLQGSVGGDALLTSKLFINGNSGYVGIKTIAPSDTLDVAGNATESGDLSFRGVNTTHNINILNGGDLSFNTSVGGTSALNPALYISSLNQASASALIGINNTNPSRTLDVRGSWGGNTYADTETTTTTQTFPAVTTAALGYYFDVEMNGAGSGHTMTWNITGLPATEGTWAMIEIRVHTSNSQSVTGVIEVNGQQVMSIQTASGANKAQNTVMYLNGSWRVMADSTPTNSETFDLAETIPSSGQQPMAGMLLSNSSTNSVQVQRSQTEYDQKAVGIVSTNPNTTYGQSQDGNIPSGNIRLALSGRVPTMVTSLDGPILQGDSIATSPLPGIGMKPSKATETVGKALEQFDPAASTYTDVSSLNDIVWPGDDGSNASHPVFRVPVSSLDAATQALLGKEYHVQPSDYFYVGKIMVLVGNGYVDPQVTLTDTGDVNIVDSSPSADFSIPHYYSLTDALGAPITRMGEFAQLVTGSMRAGVITSQQVFTNSLAIATDNVSIAGQSLHDYITGIVTQVLSSQQNQSAITSPVADNSIQTNLISPLASNSAIAIRLNNSKIEIAKDASSSAVASIDNAGNATFNGTLNAQNLAVQGDATISGTLYANNIKANSIEGLSEVVSTLSAQNITNITNMYFATPSANPTSPEIATGFDNGSSSPSSLLNSSGEFANIASYSAFLAYVPNLNAVTGIFQQGLVSLGPTSLTDTSITGVLSIGSQMSLADNSLNVIGADFQIQPLRQGGINFEGGLLAIDTAGNLTVNGNATFNKNLAVNTLSPIAGHNLNINLQNGSASGAATPNLNVNNASGSAIFAVNQLGDLVASGEATIGKLNLSLIQPALAVSDTELIATGSAGTASIKQYQKEVTIDNSSVTTNSLIYITPVGTNQTPYLERQVSGTSFSVGIPAALSTEVKFNWLIVN